MGRTKQAIWNEVQHATNTKNQAQPKPTPQGPPPMVLQNPLLVQGFVETAPPPQHNPKALGAPPMAEIGVHHLLAMTIEEVNLQTRQNQYRTNTKHADPSAASTSKTTNAPLQLPPFPCPPIRRVTNNTMARAAVSYNIMDDLAQTPTSMSSLEVLKTFPT